MKIIRNSGFWLWWKNGKVEKIQEISCSKCLDHYYYLKCFVSKTQCLSLKQTVNFSSHSAPYQTIKTQVWISSIVLLCSYAKYSPIIFRSMTLIEMFIFKEWWQLHSSRPVTYITRTIPVMVKKIYLFFLNGSYHSSTEETGPNQTNSKLQRLPK